MQKKISWSIFFSFLFFLSLVTLIVNYKHSNILTPITNMIAYVLIVISELLLIIISILLYKNSLNHKYGKLLKINILFNMFGGVFGVGIFLLLYSAWKLNMYE